jgi:hypothetical protein
MEFKRYAFASFWCAYAAIASVIILAYFWKSREDRAVPVCLKESGFNRGYCRFAVYSPILDWT